MDVEQWAEKDFHEEEQGLGGERMEVSRGRRGFSALIAVIVYGTDGFGRRFRSEIVDEIAILSLILYSTLTLRHRNSQDTTHKPSPNPPFL